MNISAAIEFKNGCRFKDKSFVLGIYPLDLKLISSYYQADGSLTEQDDLLDLVAKYFFIDRFIEKNSGIHDFAVYKVWRVSFFKDPSNANQLMVSDEKEMLIK